MEIIVAGRSYEFKWGPRKSAQLKRVFGLIVFWKNIDLK
jgi:hypothetical protein